MFKGISKIIPGSINVHIFLCECKKDFRESIGFCPSELYMWQYRENLMCLICSDLLFYSSHVENSHFFPSFKDLILLSSARLCF